MSGFRQRSAFKFMYNVQNWDYIYHIIFVGLKLVFCKDKGNNYHTIAMGAFLSVSQQWAAPYLGGPGWQQGPPARQKLFNALRHTLPLKTNVYSFFCYDFSYSHRAKISNNNCHTLEPYLFKPFTQCFT